MTRNWIALGLRTSQLAEPRKGRPRRPRCAGYDLESLETRLALSSYSAGPVLPALNPQPLPPGIIVAHPDLNPQPVPPGFKLTPPDPCISGDSASPDDDWLASIVIAKSADGADHNGTHEPPGTFSPDPTCPTCIRSALTYSVAPQTGGGGSGKV